MEGRPNEVPRLEFDTNVNEVQREGIFSQNENENVNVFQRQTDASATAAIEEIGTAKSKSSENTCDSNVYNQSLNGARLELINLDKKDHHEKRESNLNFQSQGVQTIVSIQKSTIPNTAIRSTTSSINEQGLERSRSTEFRASILANLDQETPLLPHQMLSTISTQQTIPQLGIYCEVNRSSGSRDRSGSEATVIENKKPSPVSSGIENPSSSGSISVSQAIPHERNRTSSSEIQESKFMFVILKLFPSVKIGKLGVYILIRALSSIGSFRKFLHLIQSVHKCL